MQNNNTGTLSNAMTVVALVNGMIGGIILVMPILALRVGYLLIAPIVIVSGFFSYYSCLLCIRHLRNYKDLDQAVLKHFENRKFFKIFYDLCIAFSIVVVLILYFDLICIQWSGLTRNSPLIPLLNAIVLFPVVYIMKKYHFGASLLAYGIISTIGYCLFLLYMWIIAPEGQKKLEPVNRHFPELAAALSQGFAIQMFFIPVLKKNPNRNLYKKLLGITYILGGLAYGFIGYGGALSIINRSYPGDEKPQTIVQYFDKGEWQVILLQIIYLVHLYSAYPQFLLISKKRFFGVMGWPEPTNVSLKQIIYAAVLILTCLVIKLTNVSAQNLIQLNGSVLSFVFITVIPVGLHIKCVYFSSGARHQNWQDQIVEDKKGQSQQKKYNYIENRQSPKLQGQGQQKLDQIEMQNVGEQHVQYKTQASNPKSTDSDQQLVKLETEDDGQCCDIKYSSRKHEICDLIVMGLMVISGISTMIFTLYLILNDESDAKQATL